MALPFTALDARPNLLINGDFQINQRAFAGGALAAGIYGFDRWKAATGGASVSLSAYTVSLASGELTQVVEPSAFGLASFASQQVVVSVDTPSQDLTVTFGSQAGSIAAGSGRHAVTLTLGAGDTGNLSFKIKRASGSGVTFSRVKLEVGLTASLWQARDAEHELRLARRYFFRRKRTGPGDMIGLNTAFSADGCWGVLFHFPATMRADPAVTLSDIAHIKGYTNTVKTFTSAGLLEGNTLAARVTGGLMAPSSFAAGDCVLLYFDDAYNGFIDANAEL